MSVVLCTSTTIDRILRAADNGDITTVQECVRLDPLSLEATNRLFANLEARDRRGYTPLQLSSISGKLEVVKYLVGTGANLEATDGGYTPLLGASYCNCFEVVKFLVEAGADINATVSDGDTPLSMASRWNYLSIVKYLEEAKAHQNHVQYLSDLYRVRWTWHYCFQM